MADAELFAAVLELGKMLGWHDGSGRSKHQEYVKASRRRTRRLRVVSEDAALTRHAEALNKALFQATLEGGELAELVLEQQKDDVPFQRRPRHVIGIDDPAAILCLRRRAA